jgi:regulator of extracellular matrix RemA (YlzA/DUF370 family)
MYLHIGMNVYIWSDRIIGIFNAEPGRKSSIFREFLEDAKVANNGLTLDQVKSFILTDANVVYWSNINGRTLRQRYKKGLEDNLGLQDPSEFFSH